MKNCSNNERTRDYMKLRPHHAMCIFNYVGKGYNDAFSQNMSTIIAELKPETKLCLISCGDAVCSACPNRRDVGPENCAGCNTSEKTERYDKLTLEALGLRCGEFVNYAELEKMVNKHIFMSKERFASVCGDCEWHKLCEHVRFGNTSTDASHYE